MKNVFKLFGLTALVAVIGFAVSAGFAACENGTGGGGGVTESKLVLPAGQAWLSPKIRGMESQQRGWQFRADGTGVQLIKTNTSDDRSIDFISSGYVEWELEDNGRLYIKSFPTAINPNPSWRPCDVAIHGNTLTIGGNTVFNTGDFTPGPVNIVR